MKRKEQKHRFWFCWNQTWTLLTVPEEYNVSRETETSIQLRRSEQTDEGWESEHISIYRIGDWVYLDSYNSARDCDGRFDYDSHQRCHIKKLQTNVWESFSKNDDFPHPDGKIPEWRGVKESRRDHQAERAGY
jgi:hypothetical protein